MERLVGVGAGNRKGWVRVGGVNKGGRQSHVYDGRCLELASQGTRLLHIILLLGKFLIEFLLKECYFLNKIIPKGYFYSEIAIEVSGSTQH
jgi:hypothetical protein